MGFGIYTAKHENTEKIFHASIGRDFYNAVTGADGAGMDVANYVHDEIPVNKFFGTDDFNGAVYNVNYYTFCDIYRHYFRI